MGTAALPYAGITAAGGRRSDVEWLDRDVVAHGRLPLLCFLLGFIAGFVLIRLSVRMIRARVRWWPGNITPGGQHIHHVVFGIVLMLLAGIGLIAVFEDGTQQTGAVIAALFGVGSALVLDEFALVFYLKDVYWSEQGRTSVDAVFVAIAGTGLLLLGLHPLELFDVTDIRQHPVFAVRLGYVLLALVHLGMCAAVVAKGKIWTGLVGLFVGPLLVVGAVRLSRPGAPWARWRYTTRPKKMERALRRERTLRRPVVRAKILLQNLVAGTPDVDRALTATEEELDRTVRAAPAPDRGADSEQIPAIS